MDSLLSAGELQTLVATERQCPGKTKVGQKWYRYQLIANALVLRRWALFNLKGHQVKFCIITVPYVSHR
jgi:hypothetical protein